MAQERQRALPLFAEEHSRIPSVTFSGIPSSLKRKAPPRAYPRHSASELVLNHTLEVLRVSWYRLSKLLGLPFANDIYRWRSGQHRPSALYMTRLTQLLLMHNAGVHLYRTARMDWDTGQVYWLNGDVTTEHHLGGGRGGQSGNGGQALGGRESGAVPPSWGKRERRP